MREHPGASRHAQAQVPWLEPQVVVARANMVASSPPPVLDPAALAALDRVILVIEKRGRISKERPMDLQGMSTRTLNRYFDDMQREAIVRVLARLTKEEQAAAEAAEREERRATTMAAAARERANVEEARTKNKKRARVSWWDRYSSSKVRESDGVSAAGEGGDGEGSRRRKEGNPRMMAWGPHPGDDDGGEG